MIILFVFSLSTNIPKVLSLCIDFRPKEKQTLTLSQNKFLFILTMLKSRFERQQLLWFSNVLSITNFNIKSEFANQLTQLGVLSSIFKWSELSSNCSLNTLKYTKVIKTRLCFDRFFMFADSYIQMKIIKSSSYPLLRMLQYHCLL